MRSTKKVFWSLLFGLTLLFSAAAYGDDVEDDTVPDVTARVSRVSFIRGDVRIRRDGNQDWEKASLNLPIVEGDEITTDAGGRLEIQLNLYTYIRLAENSYLKFVGLKDGAVALSLSEGTVNVRLTKFDRDAAFFEIDAPQSTVALQRAGMYRIDAGRAGANSDVRVTVTNDGEARVYSDNSGFTLKNNRTASLKIDGPLAGEWETLDASRVSDEFDMWSIDRDEMIAKRIKDAYYDKYYDKDIYGAEDLNENGEWVYTKKYGHVWRPNRSAISTYVDWSPYRYGAWRWVPPYGWTWVNDEPWAWATYHHGRWFYDNGQWYWTPYGYTTRGRSWWYPALVGVTVVNQIVTWYPLPYDYGYFNYNHCFGGWGGPRGGGHHGGHNGGNGQGGQGGSGGGPTATPTPPGYVGPLPGQIGPSVFANNDSRRIWRNTPPLLRVPPGAVISTSLSSFGRDRGAFSTAKAGDAQATLTRAIADNKPGRILPTYEELDGKVSVEIRSEKPRLAVLTAKPTGAAIRPADGAPMDRTLRTTKIFGNREPVRPEGGQNGGGSTSPETRKTGAVTRQPVRTDDTEPVRPSRDTRSTKNDRNNDDPVRPEPRETRSTKQRDDRDSEPVRQSPRSESSHKQRDDPPPRSEPTRSEPTRSEPTRSEPTRSEPTRSEPSRSAPVESKKKDN